MSFKKIIILLVLTMLVSGCTQVVFDDTKPEDEPKEEVKKEEPKKKEVVYDNSLIEEYITKKGAYDKGEYEYLYQVPRLKSDSEDAKKINAIIDKDIRKDIDDVSSESEYLSVKYYNINWKSYWNGSVVSLVINKKMIGGEVEDYLVFNYDFKTGKQLSKEDVLKKAGITKEEFIQKAKAQVARDFDARREYQTDDESVANYYTRQLPTRALEVSEVNLESDGILIYLKDKNINMISKAYSIEMPMGINEVHTVQTNSDFKYFHNGITDKYLKVVLEKNRVFVTFLDEKYVNSHFRDKNTFVEVGKDYEVQGTYSNYKNINLVFDRYDYYPYVVLTTDKGTLELINVTGARYGALSSVPVPGIKNVSKVYNNNKKEIYADDLEGNKHNLTKWIRIADNGFPKRFLNGNKLVSEVVEHKSDNSEPYNNTYQLTANEGKLNVSFNVVDDAYNLSGNYTLLGMNSEGLLYGYDLNNKVDKKSRYSGVLSVNLFLEKDDNVYEYDKAFIKVLKGKDMFDNLNKWIKFRIENET